MENPLTLVKNIHYTDPLTNEDIVINMANIGKYFRHVYCICPFHKVDYDIISQQLIDPKVYDSILTKMVLYKTNISILKNIIHFSNIIYCKKNDIIKANHFGYSLDEMILVLPIFNISFLQLSNYITNIVDSCTFNKLYDTLVISEYYGDNTTRLLFKSRITNMIKCLDESNYWTFPYNCMMNLTKLFEKRQFNLKIVKHVSNRTHVTDIIDNSKVKENYLSQIFNTKSYVDPSAVLNKKGYRLFTKVY